MRAHLFPQETLKKCTTHAYRTWHLVNADQQIVGRLAKQIARVLMGKNRLHTKLRDHIRDGDMVVVVNCERVEFLHRKWRQKIYRTHSGYAGGLKEQTALQMLQNNPKKILFNAVKGMLPNNGHRPNLLSRLKLYVGPEHPHNAQLNDVQIQEPEENVVTIPMLPETTQGWFDYYRAIGDPGLREGFGRDRPKTQFMSDVLRVAEKTGKSAEDVLKEEKQKRDDLKRPGAHHYKMDVDVPEEITGGAKNAVDWKQKK